MAYNERRGILPYLLTDQNEFTFETGRPSQQE